MTARRRHGQTKAATQRLHARRRFLEREGLVYSRRVERALIGAIVGGKSVCVERQSHRVSVHDVPHEERIYRVVYDRQRKTIVTVLSIAAAEHA